MSTIRVLLVDNGDGSASMKECFRNSHFFCFDYSEHVCPHQEALNNPDIVFPRDASTAVILEEWKPYCIHAENYDIVFLHTSNAYSKQFFEHWCGGKIVVLFTGDTGRSWARDLTLPPSAKLVRRDSDGGLACATDFIFEYRTGCPPPWDALVGRSAQVKIRERLFQYPLACSQNTTEILKFEHLKDLTNEMKLAKQRVEFDTGQNLNEKLFDHPAVQAAVKGEFPCRSAGDDLIAMQAALEQLCTPRSEKTF